MDLKVWAVVGFEAALAGMGLSHGLTSWEMFEGEATPESRKEVDDVALKLKKRANTLAPLDGGHNKFLESIQVWMMIKAPRYWWQEFDTYRVGVTKQSESTMHTLMRREFTAVDFEEEDVTSDQLRHLNESRAMYLRAKRENEPDDMRFSFLRCKRYLPESFLQTRMVNLNYKALRGMVHQRKGHKLPEWQDFMQAVKELPKADEWIFSTKKGAV